jgi:hypothetical protein
VLPMTELATDDEDGICVNSSNVISNGGRLKYLSGAEILRVDEADDHGGYMSTRHYATMAGDRRDRAVGD